jgi:hypothetical protein
MQKPYPHNDGIQSSGPCLPLEPHNHPRIYSSPQNRHTPFRGTAAVSAMRRITFTVAAFSRLFSRIYSPLLQFRAHFPKVGLWLRTGASPVLRLWPPQDDKQAAERTAPPPTLHFRISPAYCYIFTRTIEAPWGTQRTKPAQGRFFPSCQVYFGGGAAASYIVPPPRRQASPSQKTK